MITHMENISKAFKSLDDMLVESPVYLTEVDEPVAGTIRDLFVNDSSYNVLHDFDIGGVQYAIYAEATSHGESCDATYGEFDPANIDGAIVDLLDADRNFIGTLSGATPDTTLSEAEEMAGNMVNGAEDVPAADTPSDEPAQDYVGSAEEPAQEASVEMPSAETVADAPQISSSESDDAVHITYKGKDITVSDAKDESLTESKSFDLSDSDELGLVKTEIEKKDDEQPVEKIVDASAEAVDGLKKSYIGSMILRCPTCHTMIYKDAEDLVIDDAASTEDEKVYNTEDECPHCGAKDGYELIGQVASIDAEEGPQDYAEEPLPADEPASEEQPEPEDSDADDVAGETSSEDEPAVEESLRSEPNDDGKAAVSVEIKSVNEARFDRLIRNYLRETYYNVSDYSTSAVSIDEKAGTVSADGVIRFKSGKEKATRFVFESAEMTKTGKLKLLGKNESLTDRKAFTLTCSCEGGKLLSESMSYCYRIGDDSVRGRVTCPRRR